MIKNDTHVFAFNRAVKHAYIYVLLKTHHLDTLI